MNIEDQSCLLCGSDQGKVIQNSLRDVEAGLPGSYSILQCCRCGFIFLSRRLFPHCWSGLQVPRHMSFSTPATLPQALSQAGLVTVRLGKVFDPGDLSASLCNWLAAKCRWLATPRQLKIYIPLTLIAAPLVALQNLLADSGEMHFVAKLYL